MGDKRYKDVTVVTNKPVAIDSPDHIFPVGARQDNSTHPGYIAEVEAYFNNRQINVMDVGCAGGQLVVDYYHRGHFAIGLEGSTFPRDNARFNWTKYADVVLHNADLTEPYEIQKNGVRVLFDCISAWEVVEHIHPTKLEIFFDNIENNLKPGGFFVASINLGPDDRILPSGEVVHLHQSVFPEKKWREEILIDRKIVSYPFSSAVRAADNSFYICMRRKSDD